MEIIIQPSIEESCNAVARLILRQLEQKPNAVLGLSTGSTPLPLYNQLVKMHRAGGLDFSKVVTFNLDEYVGLPPEHPASYQSFMWKNLFEQINISKENVHIPNGMTKDVSTYCQQYEQRIVEAGGIDIQILGIGTDGHIGFNEPTSSLVSRTRIKTLTRQTVADNARFFNDDESKVPRHVITMGIGTIMEARQIVLLAFGEKKARAIAEAVEGPISSMHPASILQMHPNVKVCVDESAASQLTRSDYYRWVYQNRPDWQK